MKFLFLSKSEGDPATRYRSAPVVSLLRARGDTVDCGYESAFMDQVRILKNAASYDAVFIQRKLFSRWFIRLLNIRAKRIFFDFDDAVFLKSSGQPSLTRAAKFAQTVRAADQVFAGNSYLQEAASAYHSNVQLTPTCVDVNRYSEDHQPEDAEPSSKHQLTMVWIGSRSTSKYLHQHLSALDAIGEAYPDVVFNIIANFSLETRYLRVNPIDWSEASEVELLRRADVGIAPMTDDPWTRGKCALKVIQYMAAGLPVVSSRVGANEDLVVQGETGYLVQSDDEWVDAIGKLRASPALRSAMGHNARERAKSHFDVAVVARHIVSAMDEVCAHQ
ncbi:MAG: glycosyltransferase involved in cell wall biosynthesis [Candidatus Azotimanducaceae bacterium]|jgi:glycosyltransferase involved in cell wall biosynthesis